MAQPVPYLALSRDEQEAIHTWLADHGIDHLTVPAESTFAYEDATGEWTIRVFRRNEAGAFYVDPATRDIADEHVTFKGTRPLPWRTQ
jgi:hypothetical protein